ncbi:hypothetical protein, partial [Pseudomonas aeruginosa]|uniref:hypothetical protein n=1 Tax=Pseudomonas aeruginosa TaxID=287 RepID=UPI0039BE1AC1
MDGSPGFARGRAESLRVDVDGATASYPTPSGKDGPRGGGGGGGGGGAGGGGGFFFFFFFGGGERIGGACGRYTTS